MMTQAALQSLEFWRELCPSLHIGDSDFCVQVTPFNVDSEAAALFEHRLNREGYFQYHVAPESWGLPLSTMAEGVQRLVDADLVPPFAFLYDEFWLLFFKQMRMIARFLGDDYQLLPDFWVWHVDPQKGQSGWRPHRDKGAMALLPDGRPKSLTVWIPLTVATPTNGCIYVVPANRDRTYNSDREKEWQFDYADVRALPGSPGTVFVWNQAVLHWGGSTSPFSPDGPRISAAFEFQRNDVPPFNAPLLSCTSLPSFANRLALVAKQIVQYRHMYPLSPQLERFAVGTLGQSQPTTPP